MLEEIKAFLGGAWEETDARIRASLRSDIDLLNTTNETLLSHAGKQLRPLISLLCARLCSGGRTTQDSILFAAASELLHNATLLHDDVADSSPKRRGAPTVRSILGGPASVLIGDFWLVRAMDNILASSRHGDGIVRIFAKTLSDLAEGEMLQLQKAGTGDTDEEDYYRIIYNKTASLFEAAAVSAAVSVDAPEERKDAVREYAVGLGLAFQIRDDMFDYSDGGAIGKPVGIDLEEQKITLPLLGALSRVSSGIAGGIRRKVCLVHEHPEYKEEIRAFVLENGGLEYASGKLEEHVRRAKSVLGAFPESEEKRYLAKIADFTARREV